MTMGKFTSNLFLAALAIGLSIFTGSRTLDLLGWALPAGQTIYTWLGLAAFEGGMYFWSFFFISGAKGTPQRSISLIMAVFSVLAVCIATVVDLSLGAAQAGKIAALSPGAQQGMIIFVGVVIALNVAAFLACHLMAPEKLREIKAGVAEDLIFSEGLRAIEALAPSMAAEAAPYMAAEWSTRTWNRIVPGIPRRTEYLGPVGASVPALPAAPEPASLYRDDQRARRAAPSAGVPAVPENAPARVPAPAPAPASLWDRRPKFLGGQKQGAAPASAPAPVAAVDADPGPLAPSEKTSNQVYREEMRRQRAARAGGGSAVAAARRARRSARMRPAPAAAVPAPEPAASAAPAPEKKARKPRAKK